MRSEPPPTATKDALAHVAIRTFPAKNPMRLLAMGHLDARSGRAVADVASRSREFEADRSGARLHGTGEPLAGALEKLEQGAQRIAMKVDAAHATATPSTLGEANGPS